MVGIIIAFGLGSLFGFFIISLMQGASRADDMAARAFHEQFGKETETKSDDE